MNINNQVVFFQWQFVSVNASQGKTSVAGGPHTSKHPNVLSPISPGARTALRDQKKWVRGFLPRSALCHTCTAGLETTIRRLANAFQCDGNDRVLPVTACMYVSVRFVCATVCVHVDKCREEGGRVKKRGARYCRKHSSLLQSLNYY